jgi:hypothetical protein
MRDRQSILDKLRALNAKTIENGCTEAEALAAAEMVARWIDQHGFSQAELEMEDKEEIGTQSFTPQARKMGNLEMVAGAVAEFCDCKVWRLKHRRHYRDTNPSISIEFFGHESDALLAQYLMQCFDHARVSEWQTHRKEGGAIIDPSTGRPKPNVSAKHYESFEIGMMSRLHQRLTEMKKARNAQVDEATGRTGTSLVVCKTQDVDRAFAELNMKLGKSRSRGKSVHGSAYHAGRAAGDRVNITTGVGHRSGAAPAAYLR